jgi:hypothetical protein
MADMPWGAYWGVTLDRYGIRWMVNHGMLAWPLGTLPARERAPGGSRLWFQSFRLRF